MDRRRIAVPDAEARPAQGRRAVIVRTSPSLAARTVRVMTSPGVALSMTQDRWPGCSVRKPLADRITSPTFSPALSPTPPGCNRGDLDPPGGAGVDDRLGVNPQEAPRVGRPRDGLRRREGR